LGLQFARSGVKVTGLDIDVLLEKLKHRGAEVGCHDPCVPVERPSREHAQWEGTKSVPWSETSIKGFDAVLISTADANVNYRELVEWSPLIIDTRNALAGLAVKPGQLWKA
jgi:UDP-N-acetyl-D-glucosamine dehydrogenase